MNRKSIEKELKRKLAKLILKKMNDPRLSFVTISDLEVTPDLRHAKIGISVQTHNQQDHEESDEAESTSPEPQQNENTESASPVQDDDYFQENVSKQQRSVDILKEAAGFLRQEIAKVTQFRHVPELHFYLDRSIEHSIRIQKKIDKAIEEDQTHSHG